jgi:hypothetical protein
MVRRLGAHHATDMCHRQNFIQLAAAIGSSFQITDTHQRVRELHSTFSRVSSEEDVSSLCPCSSSLTPQIQIRVFKPSELWLDFETVNVGVVSLREDPPGSAKADQVLVRSYLAKVGEAKATTVRIYEGARASQVCWFPRLHCMKNLRIHLRRCGNGTLTCFQPIYGTYLDFNFDF